MCFRDPAYPKIISQIKVGVIGGLSDDKNRVVNYGVNSVAF